jgi:hypothetical protein
MATSDKERIAKLEQCVALLVNLVMEGETTWEMKGKAREIFALANIPRPLSPEGTDEP